MNRRAWLAIVLLVAAGGGGLWWWSHAARRRSCGRATRRPTSSRSGRPRPGLLTAVNVARGDRSGGRAVVHPGRYGRSRRRATRRGSNSRRPKSNWPISSKARKPTEIQQAEANLADANATLIAHRRRPEPRRVPACRKGTRRSKASISCAPNTVRRRPRSRGCRRPSRRLAGRWAGRAKSRRSAPTVAAFRAALGHGGMAARRSAASRRPRADAWPTCWPARERRWRRARRWCRCCRRSNIFVRFFVPEPMLATMHQGDTVGLTCDGCPAGLTGHDLIHFAAGRIHAAVDLQRVEQGQTGVPGRGPPAAGPGRQGSIPGQPIEVRPAGSAATP